MTVGRSPHRKLVPDMQGRRPQANLPEGNSTLLGHRDCGSESHRGARCGKTARRDLCGGRRVTGVPTATVLRGGRRWAGGSSGVPSPPGRRRLLCHAPHRGGFRPGPPTPVVRRVAGPRGTAGVLGTAHAGGYTEEGHRAGRVRVSPSARRALHTGRRSVGRRPACRARAVVPSHGWH